MDSTKIYNISGNTNNEKQNLISSHASPTHMEEGRLDDDFLYQETKLYISLAHNNHHYVMKMSLVTLCLYLFETFVFFTNNPVYNIFAFAVTIVLFARQVGKICAVLNILITCIILTVVLSNLNIMTYDLIRMCDKLKGNDTSIDCNSISADCFNKLVNFKLNPLNNNMPFSC